MKEIIGYKCKNCGKERGSHKATDLNCPSGKRGQFNPFRTTVYEKDETKPIYGYTL